MRNALRRQWFPLLVGLICFIWALVGWLAVIPNQDILVDGIQVQSVLHSPHLVWAFPGQKHGGPLEYPASLLTEWLFPGNYYGNGAVRPLLAFVTGCLAALLFRRLFATAPRWAFIAVVAVGPTIIHGLLGPTGNTVGVWWLQPNWDMAWLLVTAGALLLSREIDRSRSAVRSQAEWIWWALAGLMVGLGFYAHPAIILLIVPLLTLVVLRSGWNWRILLVFAAGGAAGVVPAAVSYVINARINTWDPSHGAFISVSYYREAALAIFGLNGIPDYMGALLPYGLGLPPSQDVFSGTLQSALMWIFILLICVSSVVGVVRAAQRRHLPSAGASVALAWVMVLVTMMAFVTFISPVWIYSSGLAILLWLTVGALPTFFPSRKLGIAVTILVLIAIGVATVSHNRHYLTALPSGVSAKLSTMRSQQEIARSLAEQGAQAVYGSYYDAVPIGYASAFDLRTVTNHYNRFPLTSEELAQPEVVIGVNTQPWEPWGDEALSRVTAECVLLPSQDISKLGMFRMFRCPPSTLVPAP